MRKISKAIAQAFNEGKTKSIGNTMTNGSEVFLHGNKIAWRSSGNGLELTLAGWPTVTTRERLNAILYVEGFNVKAGESYGFYFNQKNYNQYLTKITFNGYEKKASSKPIADNEIITLYQGAI